MQIQTKATSSAVYRVDRFVVPAPARDEFLANVRITHELLRTQPGFIRDFLLEKAMGPDAFSIITIAEWESPEAIAKARTEVRAAQQRRGFDPQELMSRLGIQADMAEYRPVDT